MPYMTSQEIANDLRIDVTTVYFLAGKVLPGFFPHGKFHMNGSKSKPSSLYTTYQHRLVGRTLERAPGNDLNAKLTAISQGFEISLEEKSMLYQPVDVAETVKTFGDRLNQVYEMLGNVVSPPRKTEILTELPVEFSGMLPEECRKKARKHRNLNPDNIYHLARKTVEDQALQYCLEYFSDLPGDTKVQGSDIIDVVSKFNPYFGKQICTKGKPWRRFRLRLIGSGQFAAPKSGTSYLIVAKEASDEKNAQTPDSLIA